MIRSTEINELAAALAKAQAAMDHAKKSTENPFFKALYADLAEVWNSIRGPLTSNGLSVAQPVSQSDGQIFVETILMHASGQFIVCEHAHPMKEKIQENGAIITYLRRYGLSAMVGVSPDDDDDGNSVDGRGAATTQNRPKAPPKDKPSPEAVLYAKAEASIAKATTAAKLDEDEGKIHGHLEQGNLTAEMHARLIAKCAEQRRFLIKQTEAFDRTEGVGV